MLTGRPKFFSNLLIHFTSSRSRLFGSLCNYYTQMFTFFLECWEMNKNNYSGHMNTTYVDVMYFLLLYCMVEYSIRCISIAMMRNTYSRCLPNIERTDIIFLSLSDFPQFSVVIRYPLCHWQTN